MSRIVILVAKKTSGWSLQDDWYVLDHADEDDPEMGFVPALQSTSCFFQLLLVIV